MRRTAASGLVVGVIGAVFGGAVSCTTSSGGAADAPPGSPDAPAADAPAADAHGGGPDAAAPGADASTLPDAPTFLVTLEKIGGATGGGDIMSDADGVACDHFCSSSATRVFPGAVIDLQAQPAPGSFFEGWLGACSGSRRSCRVVVNSDVTVSARFTAITHNLVFHSSESYSGKLGGLAGADGDCARLAAAAGLTGTYVALLSTSTVDARARLVVPGTTTPARGFVRVDGLPVADTVAGLFDDGALLSPIDVDEKSEPIMSGDATATGAWTGTDVHGRLEAGGCDDWTSDDAAKQVNAGQAAAGPGAWLSTFPAKCSDGPGNSVGFKLGLYCVMVDLTAPLAVPAPPAGAKKIYLSQDEFLPGGGLDAADLACGATKPAGVGAVRALLATSAHPASSRFAAGTTFVRPDGIVVGTGSELIAASMYNQPFLRSGIWQHADGTYDTNDSTTWAGALIVGDLGSLGAAATSCGDWGDPGGTATVGRVNFVYNGWWVNFSGTPCNEHNHPLICIEE